jgi:type II secretory pathway pseudopilin PulG
MHLRSNNPRNAFSLVEVVVAIGVFALAIVAVFGLLTPITRDSALVIDTSTAVRLAEGVNRELERVGGATVAGLGNNSLFLVATQDGSRVLRTQQTSTGGTQGAAQDAENSLNATPIAGIAERDRFYIIEVKLLTNDPGDANDNIYYNSADSPGSVPVEVRVGWPFYNPATPPPSSPTGTWNNSNVRGTLVPAASRSYYIFTAAVRR